MEYCARVKVRKAKTKMKLRRIGEMVDEANDPARKAQLDALRAGRDETEQDREVYRAVREVGLEAVAKSGIVRPREAYRVSDEVRHITEEHRALPSTGATKH